MAVSEMKLIRTVGSVNMLDDYLIQCCTKGYFQPEQAMQYLSGSMGFAPLQEENPYTTVLSKFIEMAQTSGFQLQRGKWMSKEQIDDADYQYVQQVGAKLDSMHTNWQLLQDQMQTCRDAVAQYEHFTGLGIDLSEIFSSSYLKVRFGHLPKDSAQKLLAYQDNPYILFIPCSSDATDDWGVYFAPCEHVDEVDRIFASLYFERLRIPGAVGTPEQVVEQLENNIKILQQQLDETEREVQALWQKESAQCNQVYTQLAFRNDVFEMRKYAAVHGDAFFYVGWVPQDKVAVFLKQAKQVQGITCEVEEPDAFEEYDPPVKLKNRRVFRPFEYLVSMFGMPSKGDVDVTTFVAITYTILFGLMFGDVGQGVVLLFAGIFMWKKLHMDMGKILCYCGVSATFGGFLYGSFFGYEETLDPLYHALGMAGKPVHIMDSINGILLFSIGIGVCLLLLSMLIFVYARIKHRQYGEAIFHQNGVAGMLFYVAGVSAVVDFMTDSTILPKAVYLPLIILMAVVLFGKEILINLVQRKPDWKPESWGDFILENAFEVFEYVLSYFSNTLSFLRVGAFVLVHAGMMMAVFSIAGENSNIVVVIIGNALVIVLEALFTSIQAMRLAFYEMFSRCYTGEGREFQPVQIS